MIAWSAGALVNAYFTIAILVIAWLAWNGWKQGVLRQIVTLIAVVSAYLVAWFGAESAAPLFWFLHFPAPVTQIVGGFVAGFAAFIGIRTVGHIVCKRTAQQKPGGARLSYGILGVIIGLLFGCALFLVANSAIRMLGTIARASVDSTAHTSLPQPDPLVSNLAKLGTGLENSSTSKFLSEHDPLPTQSAFATLTKLGIMVSSEDSLNRFTNYPGISELTNHPKLVELLRDREISTLLASKSYFRLLRHDKIVELAGDPAFAAEIKKLNFEKAIDFALHKDEAAPQP